MNHCSRKLLSFLFFVSIDGTCAALVPHPENDLLIAIDYNSVAYSNKDARGIVIRVTNHKAEVVFTGQWDMGAAPDKPSLYLCRAATGSVDEIPIKFELPLYPDGDPSALRPNPADIPVNVLNALVVNNSNIAPNGYQLKNIESFDNAYPYLRFDFFDDSYPSPLGTLGGESITLNSDSYKQCLSKIGNHFAGLTVHFIGWVAKQ